mgnify:CR=1 FL=1
MQENVTLTNEKRLFHHRKAMIHACVEKIYLHPDAEIEFDIQLSPRRLAGAFLSSPESFKPRNGVVASALFAVF